MTTTNPVSDIVRVPLSEPYFPFVAATFFKSFRLEYPRVPEEIYYTWAKKHVASLLNTAEGHVLVDAEDTYRAIGWELHTAHVLHYTYIRSAFRRYGLSNMLLDGIDLQICDHCTREFQPHRRGLVYIPFYFKGEL